MYIELFRLAISNPFVEIQKEEDGIIEYKIPSENKVETISTSTVIRELYNWSYRMGFTLKIEHDRVSVLRPPNRLGAEICYVNTSQGEMYTPYDELSLLKAFLYIYENVDEI